MTAVTDERLFAWHLGGMSPSTTTAFEPILAVHQQGKALTVAELTPDGTRDLGTFRDVADAWRAIDALDLEALGR